MLYFSTLRNELKVPSVNFYTSTRAYQALVMMSHAYSNTLVQIRGSSAIRPILFILGASVDLFMRRAGLAKGLFEPRGT